MEVRVLSRALQKVKERCESNALLIFVLGRGLERRSGHQRISAGREAVPRAGLCDDKVLTRGRDASEASGPLKFPASFCKQLSRALDRKQSNQVQSLTAK
jgi:hypothetical protein